MKFRPKANQSLVRAVVLAIFLTLLPISGSFASGPAEVTTLTSTSTVRVVDGETTSGFDVQWEFGSGVIPSSFSMVVCEVSIYRDQYNFFNVGSAYFLEDYRHFIGPFGDGPFDFPGDTAVYSVSPNANSTGIFRFDVPLDRLGIFFFRAFASEPQGSDLNSTCDESTTAWASSEFKVALSPLTTHKATNPWSPDVYLSDADTPQTVSGLTVQHPDSSSAPVAKFKVAPGTEHLFLAGHGTNLKVSIDGMAEQLAQNPNRCGRELFGEEGFISSIQRPIDLGNSLLLEYEQDYTLTAYLQTCSWDNFPPSAQEQVDPSFAGRTITNTITGLIPRTYPHPVHGYGMSSDSSSPNLTLFAESPITTDLVTEYVTGNSMAGEFSFERVSTSSARVSWSLPQDQTVFNNIDYSFFIFVTGEDGSGPGLIMMGSDSRWWDNGGTPSTSYLISDLNLTSYSAFIVTVTNWGMWRSDTLSVDLDVPIPVGFEVENIQGYGVAPATRFASYGSTITLPDFENDYADFLGWDAGDELFPPGSVFTVSEPVTFSAQFGPSSDARPKYLSVNSTNSGEFTLFPAFSPEIDHYYINVDNLNFADLEIVVEGPSYVQHNLHQVTCEGSFAWSTFLTSYGHVGVGLNTHSMTVKPSDFRDVCPNRIDLQVHLWSALDYDNGGANFTDEPTRVVSIEIARGESIFDVRFEGLDGVSGVTPTIDSGVSRFYSVPTGSSFQRLGSTLTGWQIAGTERTASPGAVIFVNRDTVLEATWEEDVPEVLDFTIDGTNLWTDPDEGPFWIEVPSSQSDLSTLPYSIDSRGPYRLTLTNPDGTVVSRFTNRAGAQGENLDGTISELSTGDSCQGNDPSDCPSTFSLLLETWNVAGDDGFSISYMVMRPTSDEEVCLYLVGFVWPIDQCDAPSWRDISDVLDGEVLEPDSDNDTALGLAGFSEDSDTTSGPVISITSRYPVLADTTLYAVWEPDLAPALTQITLFGLTYEMQPCDRIYEGEAESVSCLVNTANPNPFEARIEPQGEDADMYFLAHEFSGNEFAFSLSGSAYADVWYSLYRDTLDDEIYEEFELGAQSTFSRSLSNTNLCPGGVCSPVIFYLSIESESIYGGEDIDLAFYLISQPPGQQPLQVELSGDGGIGVDTYSYLIEPNWIPLPSLENATKQGFVPQGWIIEGDSGNWEVYDEELAPLLFQNQVIRVNWVPVFVVSFHDGLNQSPLAEISFLNVGRWSLGYLDSIPAIAHPSGYQFLGWADEPSGSQSVDLTNEFFFTEDLAYFAIWDVPDPAPPTPQVVASSPSPSEATPSPEAASPVATGEATVSPGTESNTASNSPASNQAPTTSPTTSDPVSTRSTTLAITRKNGMTKVTFGLPEKYSGGKATIEVKRWINNRVKYYIIGHASVTKPNSTSSGRAQLEFSFRLLLRPTDVIRIKVGRITVMHKRLGTSAPRA